MELPAEIRSLIEELQRRIETLEARVAELERENAALRAENADLKRRLGLDSSTSSKPPSSDGLRKKRAEPASALAPVAGRIGALAAAARAHHLRELKALIEFDQEPWAAPHARLPARRQPGGRGSQGAGRESALDAALLERFDTRFRDILREGLAFHRKPPRLPQAATGKTKRRPGENLLRRLHRFKDDVLRFLADFEVPFPNNLAWTYLAPRRRRRSHARPSPASASALRPAR